MTIPKPLARLALVTTLAAALVGCVVHARPAPRLGPTVVIAKGHVHTDRCGHFSHQGHWYLAQGHVHGRHCGHHLRGGVWVLVR